MRIRQDLIDEIVAHSREARPRGERGEECCGLVGGNEEEMTSVHRARNAAATWLRYEVHPSDQIRIMDEIESAGEDLVAIYHSHTQSAAYPSQTDVNLAVNWPDVLWLICSLEDYDEPVVRGFRIRDGEIEEEDLDVV